MVEAVDGVGPRHIDIAAIDIGVVRTGAGRDLARWRIGERAHYIVRRAAKVVGERRQTARSVVADGGVEGVLARQRSVFFAISV